MSDWKELLVEKKPNRERRAMMLNVDYSGQPEVLDWICAQAEEYNRPKSEVVRAIVRAAFLASKQERDE